MIVELNDKMYCQGLDTYGYIDFIFESGSFTVKLDTYELPIMSLKVGNQFILSTTENPKWHKITKVYD